jgi:hypothetical protein
MTFYVIFDFTDVPDHSIADSDEPIKQRDSVITWNVPGESDSEGEGDGVSDQDMYPHNGYMSTICPSFI